jgi:hypothetical protein
MVKTDNFFLCLPLRDADPDFIGLYSIGFLDPDPYSEYGYRSGSRFANYTRG